MTLFAAVFLLVVVPKGNVTNFVCNAIGGYDMFARLCQNSPLLPTLSGSDQVVAARITSACLDSDGLRISVVFDEPMTGTSHIQVFTTGEDYFPSEQGISDSFKINVTLPSAENHLDILVPVDLMPVGEQIFGNIVTSDEDVSSFVAYSLNVSDCSKASTLPNLIPGNTPAINSATCLPSQQLMIAFEFEGSVLGQYRVFVADVPYQLASVINQPGMLFFSGQPPPEGPVMVKLVSATDEVIVFEESYTPPTCGAT